MSLGTFFREYVYIPLGGKYHHQIRNIIIVWALTGLWHGASLNFVFWGLYFATILIIEKLFLLKLFKKLPSVASNIIGHIYLLFLTIVGIVLFYFEDLEKIKYIYRAMFVPRVLEFSNSISNSIVRENLILLIIAIIASTPLVKNIAKTIEKKTNYKVSVIAKAFIIVVFIFMSTMSILGDSYNPFLYFRF